MFNLEVYHQDLRKIESRIEDKIANKNGMYLRYANYDTVEKEGVERIIDNLDEIAVKGYVRFESERNDFFGGPKSKDYRSKILKNPTWLEVAVYCEKKIRKTRDYHHCFLEAIKFLRTEKIKGKEVQIFDFSMGS